ncbi:MAG: type III pantothenate kinase [Casimicrobiaceae bacterium]
MPMEWLSASAQAAGVVNRYERPAQLGADRWASLVAARKRAVAGEPFPPPCVVVNAGTAVTIDALDAEGVFRGGLILPGIALMLRALADNTAALKMPPGEFEAFATNTPNALHTGAIQAICGAIELTREGLRRDDVYARCYLAGGAAHLVAPHLSEPVEVVDNLVLEGVLELAQ